jgi:uncharacterized protein YwgA
MKPMARTAVVTRLRDELDARGSWAGETHLQKALYFLQEGAGVPLDFDFTLYKFGPFSFDVREELASYRAKGYMGIVAQPPYGPRLTTTESGHSLQSRFPKTLQRFDPQVQAVASLLGDKGVGDLERLGTALLFQRELPQRDDEEIAELVCQVKPHVKYSRAVESSRQVREWLTKSRA